MTESHFLTEAQISSLCDKSTSLVRACSVLRERTLLCPTPLAIEDLRKMLHYVRKRRGRGGWRQRHALCRMASPFRRPTPARSVPSFAAQFAQIAMRASSETLHFHECGGARCITARTGKSCPRSVPWRLEGEQPYKADWGC